MHYVTAKTILSPQNGINLYRGCAHGCIYCDSRSSCYGMDHPFEDIAVKENALFSICLKRWKYTACRHMLNRVGNILFCVFIRYRTIFRATTVSLSRLSSE